MQNLLLNVETEKVLELDPMAHGVRFDALVNDTEKWAEIEMQTYTGEHIGKRSRYYHSNMDMDMLDGGEKYKALKPTYVIFICTYDYMKKGEAVYFFQDYDVKNNLPLDTEAYTIILNTSCNSKLVPERLKSLFAYINDPARIEEPFIQSIDNRVQEFNTTKWRRKQMTLEHIIDNEKEKTELLTRERINRLNKKLIIEKRFDDLERATEDQEFQEQLLQEYNL